MKGLRKYLTPFAPDQSGAVSVLYELGGILVICDAGGCVGNICGFDEPRWQKKKSAVFSAGLRDMDAIMGRDELLVKKLAMAAQEIDAKFVAIIGTPVPSVIGTDYHALTRMAERKLKLPVFAVDTNGLDLFDKGEEKAYLELTGRMLKRSDASSRTLGIWGCTPISMSDIDAAEKLEAYYKAQGYDRVIVYGSEGTFEDFAHAASVEKNIVVSPSGLAVARLLEKKYGVPFAVEDPLVMMKASKSGEINSAITNVAETTWLDRHLVTKNIIGRALVVDQQVSANQLRKALKERYPKAEIQVASWFALDKDLAQTGDIHLKEEDQFEELVKKSDFDLIIGDPVLKKMAKNFTGIWIDKPEFALSGKL